MIVIGIDGKEYRWNISKFAKESKKCSQYHKKARELLKNLFPFDIIYEEVTLPGTKNERFTKSLIADFYIHTESLMIEVQGKQHYKFNSFFYKNKLEFFKAQARDRVKQHWCDINDIYLIHLPYNETIIEWNQRIISRHDTN